MTDFTKVKVGYALALLAALFSLNPLLEKMGGNGFELFGIKLEIDVFYYLIICLLGLAVYIYSIGFITEKPLSYFEKIGNAIYASSVMVPLLYFILWLLSLIGSFFEMILKTNYSELVFSILSAIITSIVTGISFYLVNKRMNIKDRNSISEQYERKEINLIKDAETLYNLGMYSATVMHAFSSLEYLVRKLIAEKGMQKDNNVKLFDYAIDKGLIPIDLQTDINTIRTIRNRAAHPTTDGEINQAEAKSVMNITKKVMNSIHNVL
ncbi:HEPN domain-containing protein [Paenibacillus taichungensis]